MPLNSAESKSMKEKLTEKQALNLREAANYLGIGYSTFKGMWKSLTSKNLIKPIRPGKRTVLIERVQLDTLRRKWQVLQN